MSVIFPGSLSESVWLIDRLCDRRPTVALRLRAIGITGTSPTCLPLLSCGDCRGRSDVALPSISYGSEDETKCGQGQT